MRFELVSAEEWFSNGRHKPERPRVVRGSTVALVVRAAIWLAAVRRSLTVIVWSCIRQSRMSLELKSSVNHAA